MILARAWAMANRQTFSIKPIKELMQRYRVGKGYWVDPFAGESRAAQVTNDLNPRYETDFNEDALYFLRRLETCRFDGALNDPPYSVRQAAECYYEVGMAHHADDVTNFKYWRMVKDELARVIRNEGICISFSWNSVGLGKSRGFKKLEILLVCHGGAHNDTIVTVERKQ